MNKFVSLISDYTELHQAGIYFPANILRSVVGAHLPSNQLGQIRQAHTAELGPRLSIRQTGEVTRQQVNPCFGFGIRSYHPPQLAKIP